MYKNEKWKVDCLVKKLNFALRDRDFAEEETKKAKKQAKKAEEYTKRAEEYTKKVEENTKKAEYNEVWAIKMARMANEAEEVAVDRVKEFRKTVDDMTSERSSLQRRNTALMKDVVDVYDEIKDKKLIQCHWGDVEGASLY